MRSVAQCGCRPGQVTGRLLLVDHVLRERDDDHLARRLPQDEVDGRREEARLPPPARRRAEDDQVGVDLAGAVDDRPPDRAGADRLRRRPRRRAPRRARAPPRATRSARASASGIGASSGSSSGTATTYSASTVARCSAASLTAVAAISSPMTPSFIGTRIRRKCGTSSKRTVSGAITRSVSPSPCERRTTTKTTMPISEPDRAGVAGAGMGGERERTTRRR